MGHKTVLPGLLIGSLCGLPTIIDLARDEALKDFGVCDEVTPVHIENDRSIYIDIQFSIQLHIEKWTV